MRGTFRTNGPDGFGTYLVDTSAGTWERAQSDPAAPLLSGGFVDLHIHGAFGIDFMTADSDAQTELATRLNEKGYDYALFTTVTASLEDCRRAVSNLPSHPLVAGFHLEGPFISPAYPGAQPVGFIQVAESHIEDWCPMWHDPRLRLVTLAPETQGGLKLVERLSSAGIRVSIGHSNATYAQCQLAAALGASQITHTFNAMKPLHHREPGVVGFALTDDNVLCELIYDRIHVVKPAADALIKLAGKRLLAVSDSTMASGLPAGTELFMWGLECVVGDGQVRLKGGTLAGSAITLADAFRNLAEDFGPEIAIRACTETPRAALGGLPVRQWLVFDESFQVAERHPA
jgi:N-acetylglucosamine-6-phosphate deacetylase